MWLTAPYQVPVVDRYPPMDKTTTRCRIIHGPSGCGKTRVAIQAALSGEARVLHFDLSEPSWLNEIIRQLKQVLITYKSIEQLKNEFKEKTKTEQLSIIQERDTAQQAVFTRLLIAAIIWLEVHHSSPISSPSTSPKASLSDMKAAERTTNLLIAQYAPDVRNGILAIFKVISHWTPEETSRVYSEVTTSAAKSFRLPLLIAWDEVERLTEEFSREVIQITKFSQPDTLELPVTTYIPLLSRHAKGCGFNTIITGTAFELYQTSLESSVVGKKEHTMTLDPWNIDMVKRKCTTNSCNALFAHCAPKKIGQQCIGSLYSHGTRISRRNDIKDISSTSIGRSTSICI
jgi:hypothetical protein